MTQQQGAVNPPGGVLRSPGTPRRSASPQGPHRESEGAGFLICFGFKMRTSMFPQLHTQVMGTGGWGAGGDSDTEGPPLLMAAGRGCHRQSSFLGKAEGEVWRERAGTPTPWGSDWGASRVLRYPQGPFHRAPCCRCHLRMGQNCQGAGGRVSLRMGSWIWGTGKRDHMGKILESPPPGKAPPRLCKHSRAGEKKEDRVTAFRALS